MVIHTPSFIKAISYINQLQHTKLWLYQNHYLLKKIIYLIYLYQILISPLAYNVVVIFYEVLFCWN